MRKILALTPIFLAVIAVLISCEPEGYRFDYDDLKENVIAVELIDYENTEPKMVKKSGDVLPFDFEKAEVLETLNEEQTEAFLKDFAETNFLSGSPYSDSAVGISIKITYRSGKFIVISDSIIGGEYYHFFTIFDPDGNVTEIIGWFGGRDFFVSLVNDFFETQIE